MNRIQKAATFVIALTITLMGATLSTAPLALAKSQSLASHAHSYFEQVMACSRCAPPVGIADKY
jgi:hypothetical protein